MAEKLVGPFPVQEVKQKNGSFFSACLPAEVVTDITFSDVRRLANEERDVERYLGVQRPINKDRVKKIRDYILSPDPTFPTAIIVAIDEACVRYDPDKREMTLFEAHVAKDTGDGKEIPFGKIARVLDGQHRLAGFFNEDEKYDIGGAEFDLNVSIFVGADLSVQAQIFATVNLAQTKVSRSLVYELEDLSKARSPFRTAHNIAVGLDGLKSSPFHQRIKRLGYVTPGRTGETITQAAFVEALTNLISRDPFADRNAYIDGRKLEPVRGDEERRTPFRNMFISGEDGDFDIADNVDNYFRAVRGKWPDAWADTSRKSGILPKTNAFRAFMRHLKDIYCDLAKMHGKVVPVEAYAKVLEDVHLKDEDLTTRTFKPGSSGESAFYKVLTRQVEAEDLFEQGELPLE
ncbi:DGQHR domain-containing protein [Ruixingdingia sedimenti]|uniref:DGQHR domain-containing protein n=1 Tax=Ruixingdingia sedimenti TaxID=3073604 RepID=A0ABU1FDG4_9RHOB|nr:DGQHR domain-containing protein [Xinfangfangia sp. LG-4]MDR5654892.1 DGQHR domain-containing protein [Xinfangfangia sp. LG-4]